MADSNNYPQSSLKLGSLLKQGNADPENILAPGFILDSLDVDFKVQAILGSTSDSLPLYGGVKYIIGTGPNGITSAITDNMAPMDQGTLAKGDVVVYDDQDNHWELIFASASGKPGSSGGGLVYSMTENAFYGFNGTVWTTIGSGTTGGSGETGAAGGQGATGFGAGYPYRTQTTLDGSPGGLTYTAVGGLTLDQHALNSSTEINQIFFPIAGQESSVATVIVRGVNDPENDLILRAKLKLEEADREQITFSDGTTDSLTIFRGSSSFEGIGSGVTCTVSIIPDGRTGATGAVGAIGATGATGGSAINPYVFESDGSVGSGELEVQSKSFYDSAGAETNIIQVSDTNRNGVFTNVYSQYVPGQESLFFRVEAEQDSTRFIEYRITGAASTAGSGGTTTYRFSKSAVEFISASTTGQAFNDEDRVTTLVFTLKSGVDGSVGGIGPTGATGSNAGYDVVLRGGGTLDAVGRRWEGNTGHVHTGAADGGFTFGRPLDGLSGAAVYIRKEATPGNGVTYGDVINLSNRAIVPEGTSDNFTHLAFGYGVYDFLSAKPPIDNPGKLYFYKINNSYSPPRFNIAALYQFSKTEMYRPNTDHFSTLRLIGVTGTNVYPPSSSPDGGGSILKTDDNVIMLPVMSGATGVGLTLGVVTDGVLFLDYVGPDGSTFGRFSTGISGPIGSIGNTGATGSVNPFNISYNMGVSGYQGRDPIFGTSYEKGDIFYEQRAAVGDAFRLYASVVDSAGLSYSGYLEQAIPTTLLSKVSGYLTVFKEDDLSKFGIFRYSNAAFAPDDGGPGGTGAVRFEGCKYSAGSIDFFGDPQSTDPSTVPNNTKVRFAINQDGQIGNTGFGIGFTYGNEYILKSSQPISRSDGAPFEIGDKWFHTVSGLEFTFLGVNGAGGVVDGTTHSNLNSSSDPRSVRWVQTNNARRGRQGPQGDKGDDGTIGADGITGATGFDWRGTWDASDKTYTVGDIVRYPKPELNTIGWPADVFDALWIAKADQPGGNQRPDPSSAFWDVLLYGASGPQGLQGVTGATGVTGFGYTAARILNNDLMITRIDADENIIGSELNLGRVVGPTGATGVTGPVAGSQGQFIFNNENAGVENNPAGSSKLTSEDSDTRVVLSNYREAVQNDVETEAAAGAGGRTILKIDGNNSPVQTLRLTSGMGSIIGVSLSNFNKQGCSTTLYIQQPASSTAVSWNANNKINYWLNGAHSNIRNVYLSDQTGTLQDIGGDGTGITLPDQNDNIGAFNITVVNPDSNDAVPGTGKFDVLINYVPYHKRS